MVNRKLVAEKAGVSVATVSRVLNNSGYVAANKREAVLRVVNELDYQPNPVAVSLKKQRTNQILYYVRDISNYYYMEVYKGIMDYAAIKGYMVLISGKLNYDQIGSLMLDGVILPEFYSYEEFLSKVKIPTVIASYSNRIAENILHIEVDVNKAVRTAVEYLNSIGHKKIAYATYGKNCNETRQRTYAGLLRPTLGEEINRYIVGPIDVQSLTEEVNFFEAGVIAAEEFIESGLDATAIVCFNDEVAIGLNSRFQSRGIRIPDDISVVGIDGHLGGIYTWPQLTTVSISPYAHGYECARVLIELVEGKDKVEPLPIEVKLIERASVKPVEIN